MLPSNVKAYSPSIVNSVLELEVDGTWLHFYRLCRIIRHTFSSSKLAFACSSKVATKSLTISREHIYVDNAFSEACLFATFDLVSALEVA